MKRRDDTGRYYLNTRQHVVRLTAVLARYASLMTTFAPCSPAIPLNLVFAEIIAGLHSPPKPSWSMGGHSAWRKRVMAGELAKGRGGAIARHRPHFGRKGKDLKLNRKGNIAGGNPKKSNSKNRVQAEQSVLAGVEESKSYLELNRITLVAAMVILSLSLVGLIFYVQNK